MQHLTGSIHSHFFRGASAAALTANPTADSEIQPYLGAQEARILAIKASLGAIRAAAGSKGTFGLQVVQEPSYVFGQTVAVADAPYPVTEVNGDILATFAHGPYYDGVPVNKVIPRDADLVAYVDGPGSDDADLLADILYGNPIYVDELRGKFFARLLEDGTDAATDAWEELEQSPVSTLDPAKRYALIGIGGMQEDEPLEAIRVSCPSFDGMVPKGLHCIPGKINRVLDPRNGRRLAYGIFSGAESLTVEVFNGGTAQKPSAVLEFIELDNEYALNQTGNVQIARPGTGSASRPVGRTSMQALGLLGGLVR